MLQDLDVFSHDQLTLYVTVCLLYEYCIILSASCILLSMNSLYELLHVYYTVLLYHGLVFVTVL